MGTRGATLRRHLRLWRRFAIMAFVRDAEYRLNFFFNAGQGLLQLALAVATFLLLYQFTGEVAGWTRAEALLLVGIYRIVDGVIGLQIAPNLTAIDRYIRQGDLDFLLLRPVSSLFLVSLRYLRLDEIVNIASGLMLAFWAGQQAGVSWSVVGSAGAALFCLCGIVILYALWLLTVTLSFWLVQVDSLDQLFYGIFETARYPVTYFKGVVRATLIFIIPVAFATTFPSQALLGEADWRFLPLGLALALGALALARTFWNYALRHYGSASS
jgi:ABC-2 type transport system permease protein